MLESERGGEVSEELSSVETITIFLSVAVESGIVSEELSSVETCLLRRIGRITGLFQKNLVVWKLYGNPAATSLSNGVSEELSSVETRAIAERKKKP